VRSAGDVNGDGLGDLVVGDPAANSGKGGAWVVLGSPRSDASAPLSLDALDPSEGFPITGDAGDGFGSSVSSADVNGDGMGDVIVGAPHADGVAKDVGAAFVVYGSDPAPQDVDVGRLGDRGFAIRATDTGSLTGTAVVGLDDVSGTSTGDLLVTAPGSSPQRRSGAGAAYVVFGSGDASPDIALGSLGARGYEIQGPVPADSAADQSPVGFGSVAAAAGDVNSDGTPDAVIGSPLSAGRGGLAYVVYGKPDSGAVDLASRAASALSIEAPGAALGGLPAIAGGADLDGNGEPDVLIGPSEPTGGSAAVYAISGTQP
jgi:hypothetical protein